MQVPKEGLEQKLQKLSSSQASIESVSAFCIFYHKDARGVVQIWDQEFYKAPPERKMSLLYLANHVLQEGRRKGNAFTDEFYKILPKALSHLLKHGDEKSKRSVTRLVGVWEERRVFGSKHIKSFRELLPQGSNQAKASGPSISSSSSLKQLGPVGAALAATQEAVAAVAEKEQEFNRSWTPTLLTTGGLDKVTTASNQLQALTTALQAERNARQAAIAALQAEIAAQAAAEGVLAQRITSCEQQQQQLQSRMGFLTAQMASVVAGLTGIAGLIPQQVTNGSGAAAAAAGSAAPALPDSPGSPQAPALEEEDDDMPMSQQQQQNLAMAGTTDGGQPTGDPTGAIFAALSALPHDARDKMSTDMQQLLAMGLLGNTAPAVSTPGTSVWPGGQQQQQQELGMPPQPTTAAAGGAAIFAQPIQHQQQQPGWADLGAGGAGFMGALGQVGFMGASEGDQLGQAEEEEEEPYDPENPL